MTLIVTRFPTHDADDPAIWRVADGAWNGGASLSQFIATDEDATVMALVGPTDARCVWSSFPDLEPKQAEGVARIRAAEHSLGPVHAVASYLADDMVVTATIAPSVMEYGLSRLALQGLNPEIVIPLGMVVDAHPDQIISAEYDGQTLVRGLHFAIPDEPVFHNLLVGEQPVEAIENVRLQAMILAAADRPVLNLREGLFAKRLPREWGTSIQRRWIARLLGGLVAASLLLGLVTWAKHSSAISSENAQALAAAQKIDPSISDPAQAEAALDRALAQKGLAKGRFAPLSAGLWRSVKSSPNVTVRELRYGASGILTVVLAAPDANSVNKALIAIQQDGFRITATPRRDSSGATLVDMTMRMP